MNKTVIDVQVFSPSLDLFFLLTIGIRASAIAFSASEPWQLEAAKEQHCKTFNPFLASLLCSRINFSVRWHRR